MQNQLIYPDQLVANMIAERLAKSKQAPYLVKKVVTGFEVTPAAQVPDNSWKKGFVKEAVLTKNGQTMDAISWRRCRRRWSRPRRTWARRWS